MLHATPTYPNNISVDLFFWSTPPEISSQIPKFPPNFKLSSEYILTASCDSGYGLIKGPSDISGCSFQISSNFFYTIVSYLSIQFHFLSIISIVLLLKGGG